MSQRTTWSCLVDSSGTSEFEDAEGVRYLSAFGELMGYAKAMQHLPYHELSFYYHHHAWYKV